MEKRRNPQERPNNAARNFPRRQLERPKARAAMRAKASFQQLPAQEEYLCTAVATFNDVENGRKSNEIQREEVSARDEIDTISTDELLLLPIQSPTPFPGERDARNDGSNVDMGNARFWMSSDDEADALRDNTSTFLRRINENVQKSNYSAFSAYLSKRDKEDQDELPPFLDFDERVKKALSIPFSPSMFDSDNEMEKLEELEAVKNEIEKERAKQKFDPTTRYVDTPLTAWERFDFLKRTLMYQPCYENQSIGSKIMLKAMKDLIRDSDTNPNHPLFTHTSNLIKHTKHCRCIKCSRRKTCNCTECRTGINNPWLVRPSVIEATAASAELTDADVEELLENDEVPHELRCLQEDIDLNEPPNMDPDVALDENENAVRNLTLNDEESIIELYESGRFNDVAQLREDYMNIMQRRQGTQSIVPDTYVYETDSQNDKNSTNDGSEDTEENESIDEIDLTMEEGVDTLYEYFRENSQRNNINDTVNHYCGLVYCSNLKAASNTKPTLAEHFEDDGMLETITRSPWTYGYDRDRLNELEMTLANSYITDPKSDETEACFTQEEINNLSKEQSDSEEELNESASHAKVEFGGSASINKIYEGPAHSLEHGWLIDSGASCHMTPFKSDLKNTSECKANVTVADGSKIQANLLGDVTILLPTNEDQCNAARVRLTRVLFVPGLNRRLFSVPTFTKMPGYEMTFYENRVHITLPDGKTADVPNNNERLDESKFANPAILSENQEPKTRKTWPPQMKRNAMRLWERNNSRLKRTKTNHTSEATRTNTNQNDSVNDSQKNPQQINNEKQFLPRSAAVDLDLLHDRLGHRKTAAIITASHHRVWADTYCVATRDHFCTSCPIATISRARTPRGPSKVPDVPLTRVYIDTVPNPTVPGITIDSSWSNLLIVVDHHSRYLWIDGMMGKATQHVIASLKRYIARFGKMREIRSDAGTEFISEEFEDWCSNNQIHFTAAAPARQHQNGICERHWASTSNMARKMLIRAHLNKKFLYHALKYAAVLHNVLPVKGVTKPDGELATPYELFHGHKPKIKNLRVFGCPAVRKRYSASEQNTNSQQLSRWNLQKGIRCIFIGLPENRAGWLFYSSNTRISTAISFDAVFDESFSTPIALSIPPFTGGVPYRNINTNSSPRPQLYDGQMEMTGDITTIPPSTFETSQEKSIHFEPESEDEDSVSDDKVKEGERSADMVPHQNIRHATRSNAAIYRHKPGSLVTDLESANAVTSTSDLNITAPPSLRRFMDSINHLSAASATVAPQGLCEITSDEAQQQEESDNTINASDCFPEPIAIKQIQRMKEPIRTKWMESIAAELKVIIDNNTFSTDEMPLPGEQILPIKTCFKTKLNGDGSLNKLKTRIVVRGDLQKLRPGENTWSPTASMRLLKTFVAAAAQEGKEIKQVDFIAAFIQAKVRERVFVRLSDDLATVCPQYTHLIGRPLRLVRGLYGLTLSGKYWHVELNEFLIKQGFKQSKVDPCLMIRKEKDEKFIKLINYVDDMLYYGDSENTENQFVNELKSRFNVTDLGSAKWYLGVQLARKGMDYVIDQSRYIKHFLEGLKDKIKFKE